MRGGIPLNLEFLFWKLPFLIVSAFKGVNFQKCLFTPSRRHPRSFQLVSEQGSHLKLHHREKRMSTSIELEPVLLQNDGSNFLTWSIYVLNAFRDISPLVEHIVDASIHLPIVECNLMLKQLMSC